ncbi:hypothetical protein GQ457_14G007810 [Hibiscus cannabinus]
MTTNKQRRLKWKTEGKWKKTGKPNTKWRDSSMQTLFISQFERPSDCIALTLTGKQKTTTSNEPLSSMNFFILKLWDVGSKSAVIFWRISLGFTSGFVFCY